ncbi:MAG: Helix-turn-helix domain protein [Firmicutes bacterium ADurb.Bin373]|nr:MAG: Helix-turn-helix domain protein [Firmicutes bacterium ADurb.Bin373]
MSKNMSNLKGMRNYKFRIYPNKKQERKLKNWLEILPDYL